MYFYTIVYILLKFPVESNINASRIERRSGDQNIVIDTFEAQKEAVRVIERKLFKKIPTATCLLHIYFLQPMSASLDDFITVFIFIMSQCFLHKH